MILLGSFNNAVGRKRGAKEERKFTHSAIAAGLSYPKRPFGNTEFLFLTGTSGSTGRSAVRSPFTALMKSRSLQDGTDANETVSTSEYAPQVARAGLTV